ncbi:hypothetical protein GC176_16375 [bacterium]|nr:hypothetical protein [bacterium]
MSIELWCPKCSRQFHVSDKRAGAIVECVCSQRIQVPGTLVPTDTSGPQVPLTKRFVRAACSIPSRLVASFIKADSKAFRFKWGILCGIGFSLLSFVLGSVVAENLSPKTEWVDQGDFTVGNQEFTLQVAEQNNPSSKGDVTLQIVVFVSLASLGFVYGWLYAHDCSKWLDEH